MEKYLECIKDIITFYTRGRKYGTVAVIFDSEEELKKHATEALYPEEWVFVLTYLGKRIATVRIGRIPPEIKLEWLVVAVFNEGDEVISISQPTWTQQIN